MTKFINELKGYQPIPRQLIESDLSVQARMLYCLMAVKPDDWHYFEGPLKKQLQISDSRTFRKYRDELQKAGWLVCEKQGREGGMFDANIYTLKASVTDVQNMYNGETTVVQNLPYGKKCRTAQNAQQTNNTLIEDNKHLPTTHTHTVADAEAVVKEEIELTAKGQMLDKFINEKCPNSVMRFKPMTKKQINFFAQKYTFPILCRVLKQLEDKAIEYDGRDYATMVETFLQCDYGGTKKRNK